VVAGKIQMSNHQPGKGLAVKPVSQFTMQSVSLHAFYVATLTQAAPVRLLCHLAGMAKKQSAHHPRDLGHVGDT